jgi:hypothetical protein
VTPHGCRPTNGTKLWRDVRAYLCWAPVSRACGLFFLEVGVGVYVRGIARRSGMTGGVGQDGECARGAHAYLGPRPRVFSGRRHDGDGVSRGGSPMRPLCLSRPPSRAWRQCAWWSWSAVHRLTEGLRAETRRRSTRRADHLRHGPSRQPAHAIFVTPHGILAPQHGRPGRPRARPVTAGYCPPGGSAQAVGPRGRARRPAARGCRAARSPRPRNPARPPGAR